MKDENPLDLEQHADETAWDVWKRRLIFGLIILLCITFAAPAFGSCSSAFDSEDVVATYRLNGELRAVGDEEFRDLQQRLYQSHAVLSGRSPQEDEVWGHFLLNQAALAEGIYVSDDAAMTWVRDVPDFQAGGRFDEDAYLGTLANATSGRLTHKSFLRTVKEILRGREYRRMFALAVLSQPSEDAFITWQEQNKKISLEYIVQEFDPVAADVAAIEPTEDDLRVFVTLPTIEARLRLPPRKVVEAAYVRVLELEASQKTELETLLTERGRLDKALVRLAKQEWAAGAERVYTEKNWKDSKRRLRQLQIDDLVKDWVEGGNQGDLPDDKYPPDPSAIEWPANVLDQFEKFWRDDLEREVLIREYVKLVAEQAEREGKSFADLATEHAVHGLKIVRNAEAQTDNDLVEQFPEGLGRDSEFSNVVRTFLTGPRDGTAFLPKVHVEPVPTTSLGSALEDRGYMVLRLADFEAARPRRVDEARDEIVKIWREHEVSRVVREKIEAVRESVRDTVTFADAAKTAGLTVQSLRNVNRKTRKTGSRAGPTAGPGETLDDATAAVARRLRHRNRVLDAYPQLRMTKIDDLMAPGSIILDDRTRAAYLIRVTAKVDPRPIEMTESDLRRVQQQNSLQAMQALNDLVGLDALKRRLSFKEIERTSPSDDAEDEEARSDDDS